MEIEQYEKRGYLEEEFKIFYLEDLVSKEIEYHYHDFDKILVFFKGDIEYTVEGKSYTLFPNDIILIPQGDSHKVKPRISQSTEAFHTFDEKKEKEGAEYVRLVIYLSPGYLLRYEENEVCLRDCFLQVKERYSHVVRTNVKGENRLLELAKQLKNSILKKEPLDHLYQSTLLLQFLILLNREMGKERLYFVDTSRCNKKIVELIHYINQHLAEEIRMDDLSEKFYLSKYHMMRQFKAETGYTIGNYISQKRLLMARELLKQGESVTRVYLDVGFKEHSSFSRAYKQLFGELPSKTGKE